MTTTTNSNSIFTSPEESRLVTICAHVDHGKTTLADNLIESNGIISERLAGTLRYLDNLEEEQRRGITIRASAIGLKHKYISPIPNKNKNNGTENNGGGAKDAIIHLLDSPGHSDFSTEVSSSLQCCDGCLVVVDAVEGMCARTHQVMREAHLHQLVPVLVINKVDRLCTDLCLTSTEAYLRLRTLLESINATCSAMLQSKQAGEEATNSINTNKSITTNTTTMGNNKNNNTTTTTTKNQQEQEDVQDAWWTFEPVKGNVIFASALFGWGFTTPSLSRSLFRNKVLSIKPMLLKQYMFGDFKYNHESGKVLKWKTTDSGSDVMPMFAEFGLQPLWEMYEGVAAAASACGQTSTLFATSGGSVPTGSYGPGGSSSSSSNNNNNKKKEEKITADTPGMDQVLTAIKIGSTVQQSPSEQQPQRRLPTTKEEMQRILTQIGASTEEPVLRSLLRRYRPLSDTVLDAVYEHVPSPQEAASTVRSKALAFQLPTIPTATTTSASPSNGNGNGSVTTTTTTTTELIDSPEFLTIQQAVQSCDGSSNVPVVAHVCKFMAATRSNIRDPELDNLLPPTESSPSSSIILGLARVMSGQLTTGNDYFVMGPKYQSSHTNKEEKNTDGTSTTNLPPKRTIRLYLLMGSSFVKVDYVPAGHLCAIQNLEDLQLKTATLCDSPHGRPIQGLDHGIRPLVKVNVEAVNAADTYALERGLKKLSMADAAVEVTATAKGERILACLGELHLEQSILDLKRVYCESEIAFRISDPIVEFGETTDWFDTVESTNFGAFYDNQSTTPPLRQTTIPPYNEEEGLESAHRGRARAILSGRSVGIRLRVIPLTMNVYKALEQGEVVEGSDSDLLQVGRALGMFQPSNGNEDLKYLDDANAILKVLRDSLAALDEKGNNAIVESRSLYQGITARGILSENGELYVPPSRVGEEATTKGEDKYGSGDEGKEDDVPDGKLDFDVIQKRIRSTGFGVSSSITDEQTNTLRPVDAAALRIWKNNLRGSVVAGFQLAIRAGPICEELVRGVMVVLEGVEVALKPTVPITNDASSSESNFQFTKPLSGGMVVAALRAGIRSALLTRPARLMESHLRLTLHSSLAGLGPLYQVLSKRRGRVLEDSMVDGTDLLLITATLPHAESFGLAPEVFRKSSGEVTAPELVFSHWDRFDEDPFWIPTTLEEREDFGEILQNGDVSTGMDNTALKYIRKVRERKGLLVDSSRTVVAAEKQRTLKR